jgi:hypothetical protein
MEQSKQYKTDKIGFAAYLCLRGTKLSSVEVKNRNRSTFVFELDPVDANTLELEYTRSDHSRFFDAFKYLREQTIRGARD